MNILSSKHVSLGQRGAWNRVKHAWNIREPPLFGVNPHCLAWTTYTPKTALFEAISIWCGFSKLLHLAREIIKKLDIALCSGVLWPNMASEIAQRALRQAAERAERHVMLENARLSMERILNYPLPPESLPWGQALFFAAFCTGCMHPVGDHDSRYISIKKCLLPTLMGSRYLKTQEHIDRVGVLGQSTGQDTYNLNHYSLVALALAMFSIHKLLQGGASVLFGV